MHELQLQPERHGWVQSPSLHTSRVHDRLSDSQSSPSVLRVQSRISVRVSAWQVPAMHRRSVTSRVASPVSSQSVEKPRHDPQSSKVVEPQSAFERHSTQESVPSSHKAPGAHGPAPASHAPLLHVSMPLQ